MNLLPLVAHLEKGKVGIMGKTLYVNMLPINASTAVLLRNSLTGTDIDYELPGYYRTQFQAIVRAPSYPAGEALMAKLTEQLTFVDKTIGENHFNYCRPRTEPVVFPLSEGNLLEFSVNFDASLYKVG